MTRNTVSVRVTEGGRIVIPAAFRKALGIKPGDRLIVDLEDDELRVATRLRAIRRVQEIIRQRVPPDGESRVDALIAERRAEAAKDAAEGL